MLKYKLWLDGKAYQGEDPERTYETNAGGNGWHVSNHSRLNVLVFDNNEPKELFGWRGLQGAIERIAKRQADGVLDGDEIRITISEE